MSDLDLLIAGAMVTFISVAGAYVAIRHRANESPVDSSLELATRTSTEGAMHESTPPAHHVRQHAAVEARMR